jgi:hypothetical protein
MMSRATFTNIDNMAREDKGHRTYKAVIGSTETTVYRCSKISKLAGLVICNFSGSSDVITVHIVAKSEIVSDATKILVYDLGTQDTISDCNFSYILRPGDRVIGICTTGDLISVHATLIVL